MARPRKTPIEGQVGIKLLRPVFVYEDDEYPAGETVMVEAAIAAKIVEDGNAEYV